MSAIFSTLEANSEYWQDRVDKTDRDKTAFTFYQSLFQFIAMPLGLCNAPGSLEQTIDTILLLVRWWHAPTYLDNIVIFLGIPQEHIGHVCKVLMLSRDTKVTLQLKKCKFFTETINYLDHVICLRRLDVASPATDAIRGSKELTTLAELRFFLGLCNVFRRSIPNFVRLAAALIQRLKKGLQATFGPLSEEKLKPMNSLKEALISSSVLGLPNDSRNVTLDTDPRSVQFGCVLLQQQPDMTTKPVVYWSKLFTDAEQ